MTSGLQRTPTNAVLRLSQTNRPLRFGPQLATRGYLIGSLALLVIHILLGLTLSTFEITTDGEEYLRIAENMLAGNGFSYDGSSPVVGKPPGMPAVLAAYLYVVGSLSGFHALQLLFLFGAYWAVSRLVARTSGTFTGLSTLAMLTAIEPLRALAGNAMTEPLFLFLFTAGIIVVLSTFQRRSYRRAVVAGILFGTCTYLRPVTLFWPIALVVVIWIIDRRHIRFALVICLAYVGAIAPWMIRNTATFDRFVPMVSNWHPLLGMADETIYAEWTTGGWAKALSNPKVEELVGHDFIFNWAPQEKLKAATIQGIGKDSNGWFLRCLKNTFSAWTYLPGTRNWSQTNAPLFWAGRCLMIGLLVVTAIGVFTIGREYHLLTSIIIGHAVYTFIILFPATTEARYLIPVYLLMVPLTVSGAIHLMRGRLTSHNLLQADPN